MHLVMLVALSALVAQKQEVLHRPDAFPTLVNPQCSHCKDEAKKRLDLMHDDRVLCWIRGYSDGGAIPFRFFLSPYRIISDTYGVFVLDHDAGFARGFAPSLDFRFEGWRNGVMVMKNIKDQSLYSCLTGVAFEGPALGQRLKPVPTLVTDWGPWIAEYPQNVAYNMFEKYQPVSLPSVPNRDSLRSRVNSDSRLMPDTPVLGVRVENETRAYPIRILETKGIIHDTIGGKKIVVLWQPRTRTAVAYAPVAIKSDKTASQRTEIELRADTETPHGWRDTQTKTSWDIAGRGREGQLKGWTLEWQDGVQIKWFAWVAEYPSTTIFEN